MNVLRILLGWIVRFRHVLESVLEMEIANRDYAIAEKDTMDQIVQKVYVLKIATTRVLASMVSASV